MPMREDRVHPKDNGLPYARLHEDLPLEAEPLRDPRPLAGRLRGLAHRNSAAIALALAIFGLTAPVLSASFLESRAILPESARVAVCGSEEVDPLGDRAQAKTSPMAGCFQRM